MNEAADAAFVDTNVLVYAYDRREVPKVAKAKALLNELAATDRLKISTQVLQELYVTLIRKGEPPYTPEQALDRLHYLSPWVACVTNYQLIREAVLLSTEAITSFWDALIVVAAARSGATILYTEDLNHGQKLLGVTVVNPFK
jgi:predicted nucleic acid-binding protein